MAVNCDFGLDELLRGGVDVAGVGEGEVVADLLREAELRDGKVRPAGESGSDFQLSDSEYALELTGHGIGEGCANDHVVRMISVPDINKLGTLANPG